MWFTEWHQGGDKSDKLILSKRKSFWKRKESHFFVL